MVLATLCLSAEGIAGDRQPAPMLAVIPSEDLAVIEMLHILELMEVAGYMEILNDFRVSVGDEDEGENEVENDENSE
jgi:hypothetical protein